MRVVVIFNPIAGRSRGERVAQAAYKHLTDYGFEVELCSTSRSEDAMRISEKSAGDADIVVAVGGDGTINEVVNGMARYEVHREQINANNTIMGRKIKPALGIIPTGTVNVLALELGIPFQVKKACDIIAQNKRMPLDLGKVNERWFTLMTGVGIDALTIHNIDLKIKKRFRELAFLGTGLKVGLASPMPEFLVRINGEEHLVTFFVAGNSRYYGGRFAGMTPKADPTDGLLDLLLFKGTKRSSLAVFWLGVPTNLHLQNSKVLYLHGEKAELLPLDHEQVVWFQTDGELAGQLPATVEIDHHALEVLVL